MPRVMQGTRTNTLLIDNVTMPMRIEDEINVSSPTDLDTFMNNFTDVENIEMIYQYPSRFFNASHSHSSEGWVIRPYFHPTNGNGTYMEGLMSGSYQPRNNKLYCYPYNFILMSNNSGQTAIYRWENWRDQNYMGRFMVYGQYVSMPCALLYPQNYRGIATDFDSGLVYDNFPQCAWSSDTFRSWWAQHAGGTVGGLIGSVIGGGGTIASSAARATALAGSESLAAAVAPVGLAVAGISLLSKIGQTIGNIRDAVCAPNQLKGQVQTNSLNNGLGKCQFTAYYMTIKKEFAEVIDDYFDRFGYACRKNKKPFRVARRYWTYTKTAGCTLIAQAWNGSEQTTISGEGGLPQDDSKKICNIYDNGITFWRYDADNGVDVGNYSQDNRLVVLHYPNLS